MISVVALVAVNIYVLVPHFDPSSPDQGGSSASDDSGIDRASELGDEVPEVHEDIEGPVPTDEPK